MSDNQQSQLLKLKNIGKVSVQWMNEVGVYTVDDLSRLGSVEVYNRIRKIHQSANILALYSLEGALWNLHWNALPPELKESLHEQVGYDPDRQRDGMVRKRRE
jgi:DNA transformation protein